MQLRIATCRPLPEPDVDEGLLLDALRARGVAARMAAWNDPGERWESGPPTLIRSTWDYFRDLDRFVAWTHRAESGAPLWNGGDVVRWNAHKRYLAELSRAGHLVVPTEFVPHGGRVDLGELAARRGWRDVVVKPAVSAGSFATRRFALDMTQNFAEARTFLHALTAERDVLVQRYVDSVDDHGERSLVWIDGEFTHSIRKTPRFSGEDERVSEALPIAPDARAAAADVLASARALCGRVGRPADLLYARVDLARDVDGRPLVMELELIEPSLFLLQCPAALERLADATARRTEHG